jgi:hypothetical protein
MAMLCGNAAERFLFLYSVVTAHPLRGTFAVDRI